MTAQPETTGKPGTESQAEIFYRQKNAKSGALGITIIVFVLLTVFAPIGFGLALVISLTAAILTFVFMGFDGKAERISGVALALAFLWFFGLR
jgi:uncharacterized membrane protein